MTKQRKEFDAPLPCEIKAASDGCLADIADCSRRIAALEAEAEQSMLVIRENYAAMIEPLRDQLGKTIAWLKDTMKSNKKMLFLEADVVNLPHGSLIHALVDKVHIPKTALATCEKLGFAEVVKIAKALDRDAIEKWSDEKLVLIGAERKQKEEFSYDLKKEAKP